MVALRKPDPGPMTVEDFLVWDSGDRSGRPWQLVDGVPMAMAPTSTTHGAIQMELGRLLGNHFVATDRQCQVIGEAGIVPRVRSHTNVRVPDLVVTCGTPAAEPTVSAPVLVVEILSPSNAGETYANVWTYTTIPSIEEILILSSTRIGGEILRRLADGNWPESFAGLEIAQMVRLDTVGFSFLLDDAYRTSGLRV